MTAAASLPEPVAALAARMGARADTEAVEFRQQGQLRNDAASPWMVFSARQTSSTRRCAFDWRARVGPLGAMSVRDAFEADGAAMSVKLFGLIPLAHAGGDDESARGELMRYLAELPWCPDATLCNNALTWRVVSPKLIAVTAGEGACLAQVDLHLSDEGLIGEVRAPDRPRATKRGFQPTPWLGRFSDYRETDGARIPWRGEVGWVLEGDEIMVWQGELRAWRRVE